MTRRNLGFVATVCVPAGPLQTHHSPAGVSGVKEKKELSGAVTGVKFTNPHGSPALAVKNQDGSPTGRVMTLGLRKQSSAAAHARCGIGKTGANALHTAARSNRDEIKVKLLQARDGSPQGFLKTAILPDGRVIRISAGNRND